MTLPVITHYSAKDFLPPGWSHLSNEAIQTSGQRFSTGVNRFAIDLDVGLFEPDSHWPKLTIFTPLVNLFFRHFSGHFPYLSRLKLLIDLNDGDPSSQLLANSICALTAR